MQIYKDIFCNYNSYYFKNQKGILRVSLDKNDNVLDIQVVDCYPMVDEFPLEKIISEKELFLRMLSLESIKEINNFVDNYRKAKMLSCIFRKEVKQILKYGV